MSAMTDSISARMSLCAVDRRHREIAALDRRAMAGIAVGILLVADVGAFLAVDLVHRRRSCRSCSGRRRRRRTRPRARKRRCRRCRSRRGRPRPSWRSSAGRGHRAGRCRGSCMSQKMISEVCAAKGSSTAVAQSGISTMSLSLIAFQPAIEEPSNITPSARKSSVMVRTWCARCCHLPRGSVKRKSTYLTSCSLIMIMTF